MWRWPVCAAAWSGVSKSPPPQSQHALTSSGVSSMRARTAARLRCDWPTASLTLSAGGDGGFGGALGTPGAASGCWAKSWDASADAASADDTTMNWRREAFIGAERCRGRIIFTYFVKMVWRFILNEGR